MSGKLADRHGIAWLTNGICTRQSGGFQGATIIRISFH
jgi:hypothetical protein